MPFPQSNAQRNQRLFGTEHPVAFVTGSASPRVGRCVAKHLWNEGFHIVFHSHRDSQPLPDIDSISKESGQRTSLLCGAVEDESNVQQWVERIYDDFGHCDLLVNSAAIWEPKPLEATNQNDFENFFRVNALATALACKHFGLAMTKQTSGGAIINIGDWATRRPYRDFAAYFSSKGAIQTITESMAVELALRNSKVRVNAILPGPVKLADGISAERRQKIIDECLLQREGTADDVAHAAVFLATNPFVTAVCLPVDGGRTVYAGPSADAVAHPSI